VEKVTRTVCLQGGEPGNANNRRVDSVLFEQATDRDLEAILHIEQASFSTPWTRKMFEVEMHGNPFASLVVGRSEGADGGRGKVLGYICFWVVFEELRLMNLAVAPAARRRGLATALVHHALTVGRERGARRAVLEVRSSNEAARRLYERMGFAQVALRAKYYTNPVEDALLLELAIGG
jgi:ribosomal-protein-alanine N-acetyltransferase